MVDIAVCRGDGCASKDSCHRFRAEPGQHLQSYGQFAPLIDGGRCPYFWPLDRAYTKLRPLQAQIDGGAE